MQLLQHTPTHMHTDPHTPHTHIDTRTHTEASATDVCEVLCTADKHLSQTWYEGEGWVIIFQLWLRHLGLTRKAKSLKVLRHKKRTAKGRTVTPSMVPCQNWSPRNARGCHNWSPPATHGPPPEICTSSKRTCVSVIS